MSPTAFERLQYALPCSTPPTSYTAVAGRVPQGLRPTLLPGLHLTHHSSLITSRGKNNDTSLVASGGSYAYVRRDRWVLRKLLRGESGWGECTHSKEMMLYKTVFSRCFGPRRRRHLEAGLSFARTKNEWRRGGGVCNKYPVALEGQVGKSARCGVGLRGRGGRPSLSPR